MHPDSKIPCQICGKNQRIDDRCDCGRCEDCGEIKPNLVDGFCADCWEEYWEEKNYRFV